jgi:hypothetical protein
LTYLAGNISISVEETKWIVCATVHRKTDIGDIVVGIWCSLRASKRTLVLRTTDIELVVVRAVRLQVLGFDLDGKIYVRAGEDLSGVDNRGTVLVVVDLVLDAHRCFGDFDVLLIVMVE